VQGISAASTEQSAGASQVGEAVTQMDQASQKNAALVEESAAAAESLRAQAQQLAQVVAVFKLAQEGHAHAMVAPAPVGIASKPAEMTFPAVERRGPDRSKKVSRLAAARPAAAPPAEPPALTAQATTRKFAASSGGDDDWTTLSHPLGCRQNRQVNSRGNSGVCPIGAMADTP
jgi:methyl-accepting chemotaxis protein